MPEKPPETRRAQATRHPLRNLGLLLHRGRADGNGGSGSGGGGGGGVDRRPVSWPGVDGHGIGGDVDGHRVGGDLDGHGVSRAVVDRRFVDRRQPPRLGQLPGFRRLGGLGS